MNHLQRAILLIAFLAVLVMSLFPPWTYVFNPPDNLQERFVRSERAGGYHFLLADHIPQDETGLRTIFGLEPIGWESEQISLHLFSLRLDRVRLAVQIGTVLVLTTILCFALHRGRN